MQVFTLFYPTGIFYLTDIKKALKTSNPLSAFTETARSIMNKTLSPFNTIKISLGVAAVTIGVLSCGFKTSPQAAQPVVANVAASEYQLLALRMTGDNHGEAIIRLDGFRVTARFEVEAFPDSYGVPGSEFTAVDVTSLNEVTVSDALGNPYNDFTNHIDHQNFNALIKGYIEKHRLVEAG